MSAPTATPSLKFTPSSVFADTSAHDQALISFLRNRIAEVSVHGCQAERKALAGAAAALDEFEEKAPRRAHMAHDDVFLAQIDTLRWVLHCTAGTWSRHPDFSPAFRPTTPVTLETQA